SLTAKAERAVLDRFSVVEGDGTVVKLRGYDADPEACDPELLTRLRFVIADVITHWVQLPDENVASVSRGGRSVTFKSILSRMPRSAFRLLDDYDQRTPLYRV